MSGRITSPSELAVARARLATTSGRRKLDVVFEAEDPKALVRSLPAEDLYFAIRDIGLSDSVDLVGLAAPSQFRAFVDMDAWDRDALDLSQLTLWLRLAMEGARHAGEFRAKRKALDAELVVLLLKTQTVVHPLEEGVDPVLQSDNWLRTAEGKYLIEILAEGDDGVTTRKLLEDFIAENPFEATRLFEATRWEVQSELEENCSRWRRGRMRDMGFPEFEEAIRIWSPLPKGWTAPESAPSTGRVAGIPALLLVGGGSGLFLDRIAERLPDEARGLFNEGLVYLLNCALVADGIDPKELDLARHSLAAARDQLSLGLELASEGDETHALALLASTPAIDLFRLAVTALLELQREATSASRTVAFGEGSATALESPDAELISGLRRKRPRLYDPASKRAGYGPSEWRALRSRDDMSTAHGAVSRARLCGELTAALGFDAVRVQAFAEASGRATTAVTVGQLVTTLICRRAFGFEGNRPLSRGELTELANRFFGGKLPAAERAKLVGALDGLVSDASKNEVEALVSGWVDRFERELGPVVEAGTPDPRFIETILVAVETE